MNQSRTTRRSRVPIAFTLMELMIVIAVIVILISIGVPTFRAALASSDKSLAENQFRIGLATAREAAVQNASRDTAAVFFFEPGGRLLIVPCIFVGTIVDQEGTTSVPQIERDIFVTIPEIQPVQLPRGWVVRAFAAPGSLDRPQPLALHHGWYEQAPGEREFETTQAGDAGNWVFPETGFYENVGNATAMDPARLGTQGVNRQSFMVRFRAGTGSVDLSENRLCLVIDPVPSKVVSANGTQVEDWRTAAPFVTHRPDDESNLQRYVKRLLTVRDLNADTRIDVADSDVRRQLIGSVSSDTVLCRPVTELALYREQSLAKGLEASGVNSRTGTIYGDPSLAGLMPRKPIIDTSLFGTGASTSVIAADINAWITGKLQRGGEYVETDARIFTIDRYLGQGRKIGDDKEIVP